MTFYTPIFIIYWLSLFLILSNYHEFLISKREKNTLNLYMHLPMKIGKNTCFELVMP